MSNRGSIVTNPTGKSEIIAETARCIPLFWLSLLSPPEIKSAEGTGQFEVARLTAISRAESRLPLYVEAFDGLDNIHECCELLIEQLKAFDSETIGIELTELLSTDEDPVGIDIAVAIDALEGDTVDATVTVPGQTVQNPFTGESMAVPERTIDSLAEILLAVCLIDEGDLETDDPEEFSDLFVGHRWS